MRRSSYVALTALALAMRAAPSGAQSAVPDTAKDFLLRIDAPVTIAAAESASTVWVIGDTVTVKGTVRRELIVMGGHARVDGNVSGGIAVFNGSLELAPTARVGGDIYLYRSTVARAPGAVVAGRVDSRQSLGFGQGFALAFWVSMTIVVVAFALLYAAVGGSQLAATASSLLQRPGHTVVATILLWSIALFVAIFGFVTVIGTPLGIAILVFLMPALAFTGYLVTGTLVGAAALGDLRRLPGETHPYRAAALGVLILQVAGFIPFLGFLVVLLASAIGAGALAFGAWDGWRGRPVSKLVLSPAH